jgi:putative pyoverdin transport system ATP-binding/permease protein
MRMILTTILFVGAPYFCLSQAKVTPRLLQKAEAQIRDLMAEGDIPGLSVVIIKEDQQIALNYGFSNLKTKQPVTSQTLFELGSCSKAFTALAIVYLEQQGKIDFDDHVSDYIPWFHVSYKNSAVDITIRQLLHHTSGIPWNTISKIPQSTANDALAKTVRQLSGQELYKLPGKEYQYATINYDVLALIIEVVSREPFENFIQKNILRRLQLHNTTIGIPKDSALMATGHKIGFFSAREYDAPVFRGNYAAGYVISNNEDIARWLKLQMGLMPSEMSGLIRLTHERDESVPLHGMASYAKGWEVLLDGTGEISHGGLNPNFTSYIAFRPDAKLGIALLANANSNYTSFLGNKLMKLLAGEETEKEFDPGDGNDKAYSGVSLTLAVYIIVVFGFLLMIVIDIIKERRQFEKITLRKARKFAGALILILPFLWGVYLLPEALFGFTWEAILVWSPSSFSVLIDCIAVAAIVTYLAYLVAICFPDKNQYRRKLPRILLMSILSGLANVVVIIMVTSVIDSDIKVKYLIFYYGLTLALYLLGRRFVQVSLIRLTRGLVYDIRIQLIDKVFSTSYENFEKIDRGRVYTTLNDDVNTIGQSTNLFVALVTSVITAVGAFLYLASISFWATMLTVFLILTLATIYYFAVQRTNIYFEKARDSQNVFMGLINGMIDGFKEISLHKDKKMEYRSDVAASANEFREKTSMADIRFVNAFLVGESLLVILLGVVSIGMPEMFPNVQYFTIMSFVIVLLYLIGPVNSILNAIPVLMNLRIAWNRVTQFITEIPATLNLSHIPEPRFEKVYKLEAKGLEYQFKNGSGDCFSIGPIDLEVVSGEILFLIGGNGSGKTTLAKLLSGLYEPSRGEVLINDKVLKNSELSEHFSAVFSPPYLFQKLYNIDVKNRTAALQQYLQVLDLDNKVEICDNKYSTIDLSSGQKKRLALLQCYLEDSPIYLFDEWAADQDPHYRHLFYTTLLPEMKMLGKIVIAITHDDHYFYVADRILKLNRGVLDIHADYKLNEVN